MFGASWRRIATLPGCFFSRSWCLRNSSWFIPLGEHAVDRGDALREHRTGALFGGRLPFAGVAFQALANL